VKGKKRIDKEKIKKREKEIMKGRNKKIGNVNGECISIN